MTIQHWPNHFDVENQIEPKNVIFIDARTKRIPAEEFVTADDIANQDDGLGACRGMLNMLAGWAILGAIFGLAVLFARAIR